MPGWVWGLFESGAEQEGRERCGAFTERECSKQLDLSPRGGGGQVGLVDRETERRTSTLTRNVRLPEIVSDNPLIIFLFFYSPAFLLCFSILFPSLPPSSVSSSSSFSPLPQPLSNRPTCVWSLTARLLPVNGDTKSSHSPQMLRVDLGGGRARRSVGESA